MKKFGFLVHHADYIDFLEELRRLGVLHVSYRSVEPSESLREEMARLKEIQTTLRDLRNRGVDAAPGKPGDGEKVLYEVRQTASRLEELEQDLKALQREIDFSEPWGQFDIASLERLESAGLAVHFFTCPVRRFRPDWAAQYPLRVINTLPPDQYFVVVTPESEPVELDAEELPRPTRSLEEMEALKADWEREIERLNDHLDHWAAVGIPVLEGARERARKSIQLVRVVESTRRELEGKVMLMEGFAPAEREAEIVAFCEKRSIPFLVDRPTPEDGPPILLRNRRFARLFEPIGRLFALPNYAELDLTPFFAPFFMLFFGFCLGDAGYGLVLVLGATLYKRRAAAGLRPILSLVQFLGLATILFGLLTGTLFGLNLLEEEYAFLGTARDFMLDSNQAFQLALVLGVVQIFFGLLIKGMNQVRQFGWAYSIATWGWVLLLLSLLDMGLPRLTGSAATIGAWIGVGLILLFNDPKAGLFGRLGKGIWELYGITGIFGDLLSYIRLFALGISSAILGFVVNDIALQIKGSMAIVGPILFVIFLLIGHGLNLLIASLGAFVHPMRLTFVEFYKNAGFAGGGKPYEPFSADGKQS